MLEQSSLYDRIWAGGKSSLLGTHSQAATVLMLLTIHAGLLAYSGSKHSPTFNEPAHLAAGLSHWERGTFEQYRVNPHLVRTVAAIPVLIAGYQRADDLRQHPTFGRYEFVAGRRFIEANAEQSVFLFTIARWACIPFCLAGGCACYLWSRDLYGRSAGILACILWCFSPDILGHGSLVTTDAHATALGAIAGYSFWKWLKEPTWGSTLAASAATAIAILAKSTHIALIPVEICLFAIYYMAPEHQQRALLRTRFARMFPLILCGILYFINLGYGFQGALTPISAVRSELFESALTVGDPSSDRRVFCVEVLRFVILLFPHDFIAGLDAQTYDFENGGDSYLNGTFRRPGWWYFYIYAFAFKNPLGTIGLLAMTVALRLHGAFKFSTPLSHLRRDLLLLLPLIVILTLVSRQTGFTIHYRYAMPCLPFLFVWCGQLTTLLPSMPETVTTHDLFSLFRTRFKRSVAFALVTCSILECMSTLPHNLSHFNHLAGGSAGGSFRLLDSNIDWGQDLLYLKLWQDQQPVNTRLSVALYTDVEPRIMGLHCDPFEPSNTTDGSLLLTPGWYAVSVSLSRGMPWYSHSRPDGTSAFYSAGALTAFQSLPPEVRVGGSILLYRIERPTRISTLHYTRSTTKMNY